MSRYMTVWFIACWVNGSHEQDFTFRKRVDKDELIETCRLWQPARIKRVA